MSKDRKHSRITITKGMGTVTQDVLTSDLQQLGQGIEEAKSSLQMGDITDKIKAAVNAATQLNGKVVKTAGGYFKVTTLNDPRPAIIAKPEYYDNLKKYQDQLKVINAAIRDIEMQFESNRREIFTDLRELFPNSPIPLKRDSPASIWLSNALANLHHTYYETNKFKTLTNQKKTLEDQLKVLRDTGNRHQEQPLEEISDNTAQTRMRIYDYHNLADAIQDKIRQAIQMGNKELIQKLNKERDDLDARVKQYGLVPESQLDEISNEKLGQYKTAAYADSAKADSEGDYDRGNKRFGGIIKATKKQFKNDIDQHFANIKKKSAISQGINELAIGPTGPKGPKDYGQPNSSRYLAVQGPNKFVLGTTNNYVLTATIDKWGLEWDEDDEIWYLDSPGAAHIADASEGEIELPPPREQRNQIHDLVTDYLNARNSADLQKVALYYGHTPDGEMATNEGIEAPRFNSKQEVINHFVKNGKSAAAGAAAWERGYRGSSKKPIELKKPPQRSYHDELDDKRYSTFENLGNQLKTTAFEELVKAKLVIARQIEAEAEAFERDLYKNNTVQKAQQGLRKEFEPTPVAQPGEKHSVLKDRLKYLDIAKQKFEKVNTLIKAIRKNYRHYEVANKMDKLDKSLLPYVEVGTKDNYKSLFVKLSKVENELATLYPTAAAAVAKKNNQGVAEEQLNELDMFAPVTTFIKMTDGSYIQSDWRRHQFKAGLDDAASFINFKPVDPNVAKKLGLDSYQRTNAVRSMSDYRNGTIAHGGAYQGSGPLATRGYEVVDYNKPETMEELPDEIKPALIKWVQKQSVTEESCPHCNGPMFSEMIMNEKKDACYYKVKSRYKVWPSAYASGALVKCRNKGASNWGNSGKKNESSILEGINRADESLHDWFNKEKWVRMDTKGKIKGPCAKEPGEGKPKCLPQSKAHSLGKKGRASAAQRKRREDPNPERSGKAINVDTKKKD